MGFGDPKSLRQSHDFGKRLGDGHNPNSYGLRKANAPARILLRLIDECGTLKDLGNRGETAILADPAKILRGL